MIVNGIFYSVLKYCIPVFGNVWGVDNMDMENRRYPSFGKEDLRRLQVLQNKVCRLKTGLPYDTPTSTLIKASNELSVHQYVAFSTLLLVHKIVQNKKPKYLAEKLKLKVPQNGQIFPHRKINTISTIETLSISRGAFVYRGSQLFNNLPQDLRCTDNHKIFKKKTKEWVKENVAIKPP